jgi:DNA-binding CsgD family transcriptional regulator
VDTKPTTEDRVVAMLVANPLWQSLTHDAGGCVAVINGDGRVLFANEVTAVTVRSTVAELTGRLLDELLPPAIAKERLGFIRRVLETSRPLVVDAVFCGMYRSSVYRPMNGPAGEKLVLCVGRTGHTKPGFQPGPDMDYVRSKHDDAGQFSNLTARELEILRLIGEGLTTADIAKRLHRSVKTVEWHRVSLGTKLGANNRVELARLAIDAGLVSANTVSQIQASESPEA